MKKLSILTVLSLLNLAAFSQSETLNGYIQQGITSNLALKQQQLEVERTMQSIAIAKANFYPKVAFTPSYTLAAGGRKLNFPIGDLLNPVYSTLNKLTQSNSFPQVENVNEQLAPNNFQETVVTFQYPIFNSDIKYNYLIQKELLQTEEAKRKVIEYELKSTITTSYYQYLQSLEGIRVLEQARGLLQQFVSFNQKLVKNQVALQDVVLSAEYEVSKLDQQLTIAQKNSQLAQSYFNFLINSSLASTIQADTTFISNLPIVESLENYQQAALEQRPELAQIQTGIQVSKAVVLLNEKNILLPQVFMGGNAGFQGFGYAIKDQAYAVVKFGLNWDLYHGKEKQHKLQQANIQKTILETKLAEVKQQIGLQVAAAYYELDAAKENFRLSNEGVRKAEGVMRIVESRYRNGNAIYIEYLKAQNDVTTARMMQSLARYDVWVKKAQLDKVSGRM